MQRNCNETAFLAERESGIHNGNWLTIMLNISNANNQMTERGTYQNAEH
jgi:hypothetical protein